MARRLPWWRRIPIIRRLIPPKKVPVPLAEKRDRRLKIEGFLRWERVWMVRFALSSPFIKLARRDRRAITRRADRQDWSDSRFYRAIRKFYASHNWAARGVPTSVLVSWMLGFYYDLAIRKGLILRPVKGEEYPLDIIPKPRGWALRHPRYKGDAASQKQRARERQREARRLEMSGAERARREREWRGFVRLDERTRRFV